VLEVHGLDVQGSLHKPCFCCAVFGFELVLGRRFLAVSADREFLFPGRRFFGSTTILDVYDLGVHVLDIHVLDIHVLDFHVFGCSCFGYSCFGCSCWIFILLIYWIFIIWVFMLDVHSFNSLDVYGSDIHVGYS